MGLISGNNTRDSHEAFEDANGVSHAFAYDFTNDGRGIIYSGHDTAMAGIVCSRGGTASHPNDIGVAPGADIYSARVVGRVDGNDTIYLSYVEDALAELVENQGCRVIVSGLQLMSTADGQSEFSLLYDYYAYSKDVIFANAAGNFIYDENHDLITDKITVFGDAYNGITTGGLRFTDPNVYGCIGSISCGGPTQDGRNKPEVAAPSSYQVVPYAGSDTQWVTVGNSGGATSYAVPHTAGVAALLLDYVAHGPFVDADAGHNVVIKAAIVNSTFPNIDDRAGNSTNPADVNNVWNVDRGYGRIDALRALQIVSADRIDRNVTVTADRGWAYDSIGGYETHVYYLTGQKHHRLVLTAAWNRRVNKTGGNYWEELAPEFNLDMTIRNSQGQILYAETDDLNNTIKVELILPQDGIYEIYLKNDSYKSNRTYAMAFELLAPLTGDFNLDYTVDGRDLEFFVRQWLDEGVNLAGDIDSDGIVNFYDFALLMSNWTAFDERYYSN